MIVTDAMAALVNSDLRALRDYVTAPGSQNQSEATVRLLVTHSNLKARFLEIRLDLHVRWLRLARADVPLLGPRRPSGRTCVLDDTGSAGCGADED